MSISTMISIDWDFFLWRGSEAREPMLSVTLPDKKEPQEVHSLNLFDWGHSEGQSALLQNILWNVRWQGFTRVGLDAREITGHRCDQGGVEPGEFALKLCARFDLTRARMMFGDSHAMGYIAASYARRLARTSADGRTAQPVHVVHFDAHHDLGYSAAKVKKEAAGSEADCASWLYHALRRKWVADVTVVYPDWREQNTDGGALDAPHLKKYRTQIRALTWSEWLATTSAEPRHTVMVNAARSSAWTPPWYDASFAHLIAALPVASRECMDCSKAYPHVGDHDACKPRAWAEPTALDWPEAPQSSIAVK
jgi:hypothetical protein